MEKLKLDQLFSICFEYNRKRNIRQQYQDKKPLYCVIVVSQNNFKKEYSIESRSYKFRSDEKYFLPTMLGKSIFANSLDGTDSIRLDWYIDIWEIEYCYIINEEDAINER